MKETRGSITEEEKEILERVLLWEKNASQGELGIGWYWQVAQCYPAMLNKMIIKGLIRLAFTSGSGSGYLVNDDTKLVLAAMNEPVCEEKEQFEPIDTTHMFDDIVGYNDVKELILASLTIDKPVHVLLHGPPAIAKSMFLWDIERTYGSQCLPMIGSATSRAGMWKMVEERLPRILLIDELEKMDTVDTDALLSLMEYGRLIRTKVGKEADISITVWVFATANKISNLTTYLLSRFAKFPMKEYTNEQFFEVVKHVLEHSEKLTSEEAAMVAEQLVGKTHDIRDAIRVARISQKVGIHRAIELLIR